MNTDNLLESVEKLNTAISKIDENIRGDGGLAVEILRDLKNSNKRLSTALLISVFVILSSWAAIGFLLWG